MEARTKQRYIRMPARKLRRVINEVRGKSVVDAVNILKFMPYFAAKVVEKNIKCAAANASEKLGVLAEELIVSEVYADEGPTYKRARPRAQGRVYRIQKRTSHLTVVVKVSEKLKEKLAEKKKSRKKPAAKKETKPETVETPQEVEAQVQEQEVKSEAETTEEVIQEEAKAETEQQEQAEENTNKEENNQ